MSLSLHSGPEEDRIVLRTPARGPLAAFTRVLVWVALAFTGSLNFALARQDSRGGLVFLLLFTLPVALLALDPLGWFEAREVWIVRRQGLELRQPGGFLPRRRRLPWAAVLGLRREPGRLTLATASTSLILGEGADPAVLEEAARLLEEAIERRAPTLGGRSGAEAPVAPGEAMSWNG